jgi:hypothetical protein
VRKFSVTPSCPVRVSVIVATPGGVLAFAIWSSSMGVERS